MVPPRRDPFLEAIKKGPRDRAPHLDYDSGVVRPLNRADPRVLWGLAAAASPAVEILWTLAARPIPDWLLWIRLALLAVVLAVGTRWDRARPLRAFCFVYSYQLAGLALLREVTGASFDRSLAARHGFVGSQLLFQLVWMATWVPALVWQRRDPDRFSLRVGHLGAKVRIGHTRLAALGLRWNVLGPALAVVSTVCASIFVGSTGSRVSGSWSMMPWAVLFAAINAFGEEAVNRSLFIGAVRTGFGTGHAVVVSAAIFGITHWNGLPGGAIGVLMTLALALVAGRAMVDTQGSGWPWFMHALPDWVLFYYWGIGSVGHG
jgi:membrane protease YdiL (CAAX protease family)